MTGSLAPHVAIAYEDDRAFLRAAAALEPEDPLVLSSPTAVTTVQRAMLWPRIGPVIQALFREQPDTQPRMALILLILFESCYNPSSSWQAYFDALPSVIRHPLYWKNDDAAVATLVSDVVRHLAEVGTLEAQVLELSHKVLSVHPELFGSSLFSSTTAKWATELRWAAAVEATRSFQLSTADGPCLLPVLDLLSHRSSSSETSVFVDADHPNIVNAIGVLADQRYKSVRLLAFRRWTWHAH